MFCRGPKMDQEPDANFDFDRMVKWLQLHMQSLRHENLHIVKPEWIRANPQVLINLKREDYPEAV